MIRVFAIAVALLLSGCVTAWNRPAPAGVYPAGELSGAPTLIIGWKFKLN